jgi:hypothetical protein
VSHCPRLLEIGHTSCSVTNQSTSLATDVASTPDLTFRASQKQSLLHPLSLDMHRVEGRACVVHLIRLTIIEGCSLGGSGKSLKVDSLLGVSPPVWWMAHLVTLSPDRECTSDTTAMLHCCVKRSWCLCTNHAVKRLFSQMRVATRVTLISGRVWVWVYLIH